MTKITGVCGWPVAQNLSPYMHNAAFQALGLDWEYLRFAVRPGEIGAALKGIAALGIVGVNLSLPHKVDAVAYLDEISPKVQLIGSANTVVVREDGSLYGHNTDGEGFLLALRDELGILPQGLKVALMGAGGVSRSIAANLALAGATEIAVYDADPKRVTEVALLIEKAHSACRGRAVQPNTLAAAVAEADLVVNATPVGMWPDVNAKPVVDPDLLHPGQILYDVIHNPPESKLVEIARQRGLRALGGLPMLVRQGALAFQVWTGIAPPLDVMREALTLELTRRHQSQEVSS